MTGPSFETPAEIRAFRTLGADAVGMSTVHETSVARHCGLRVVAVSAITNYAEGMSDEPLSHEQTLRDAQRAADDLAPLLDAVRGGAGRVMHVAELIRRKRDGGELTDEEIGVPRPRDRRRLAVATPRSARSRWRSCSTG